MRTRTTMWMTGAAAAVVALAFTTPVSAVAGDQAGLDTAMALFNERMTEAGWVSQGPPDESSGGDEESDPSPADDPIAECFGNLPGMFEGVEEDQEFPGEIARSMSDEFTFPPATDVPETTDSLFSIPDEEEAAAFAVSVDEANVAVVVEFVDVLGSEETSECLTNAIEAGIAAETETTGSIDMLLDFDVSARTQGDLGIGDHSAEMTFGLSMNMFGVPMTLAVSMVFANVDNHLVAVMHSTTGEADQTSGFDPHVELQALVDVIDA